MGLKEVKKHLEEFNAQDKIIVFENATTKSAKEAAETIGCTEAEIAKTMGFIVNDTPIVIVTCGDARIDNKKFKERFKVKTKMIKFEDTNKILGHNSGGICPFGLKENVEVYLDEKINRFKVLHIAAGESNAILSLTPTEIEKYSKSSSWVDVCKIPESSI